MPQQPEVVIRSADGTEHVFPPGFDPKKAAAIVQQQSGATPPASGGVSDFASEFWKRANPLSWAEGLIETAKHPLDAAVNMVRADPQFLSQAKDAAAKGDYLTAGRKVLSYLSMGLGHELDSQADMLQKGDYAKGAGAMAGMATQFLAPDAVAAGAPAAAGVVRGIRSPNPAVAEAVALAKRAGVPLDAATATDNAAVRAVQHLSDKSLGGAQIAGKAVQRQAEGLATLGEQLAAKAHPSPVTAEQAGAGTQNAVRNVVHEWNTEASKAYGKLRAIEADPKNLQTIEPPVRVPDAEAPGAFPVKSNAKTNDLFLAALDDAKRQGFKGSPAELKVKFDEYVQSAKALKAATAEGDEYSHAALLKEIRERGGIRPFDKDTTAGAPTQKLRGDYEASQQANAKYYGKNAIYRNDGLALDDMLQQLSEDPKWGVVITKNTDLIDLLHSESMKAAKDTPGDLQHYLQGAGLRPGVKWWEAQKPAQQIPMAVDLRPVKAALQDTYDGLMREGQIAPLMGDKATAARALDRLMHAPDHAPLSTADAALGELKSFARADNPDLRSVGQGKAVGAINELHAAVQQSAEAAGPEAVQALQEGRQATTAKYVAAKVLKRLEGQNGEPVAAFRRLTAPGNQAVKQLRAVVTQSPESASQIGRAVLDGMLEKATAEGSFSHADKLFADWQKLGGETKQLLFKDPAYIRDLDSFFLLSKQIAKNANPSGTAHTVALLAQGSQVLNPLHFAATVVGTAGLSKFLHSPAGVRLLTEGVKLPRSAAAQSAWMAKVGKFATANGLVQASQHPVAQQ